MSDDVRSQLAEALEGAEARLRAAVAASDAVEVLLAIAEAHAPPTTTSPDELAALLPPVERARWKNAIRTYTAEVTDD